MNDLPTAAISNVPEFTLSEISCAVKRTLEGNFGRVRVRGETEMIALAHRTLPGPCQQRIGAACRAGAADRAGNVQTTIASDSNAV